MENPELFKKEVEDCSHIRYAINEDHFPVLNKLAKIYRGYFNRDSGEFKYAKDIWYYKGGWPTENTPPRSFSLAKHIATAYMVLSFIGKEHELVKNLDQFGLKLELVDAEKYYANTLLADTEWQTDKKRTKLVKKNWELLFGDEVVPDNPKILLQRMMDLACEKQAIICKLADEIKIDKGEQIEAECGIPVGDFTKAVGLKYRSHKGKDVTANVDKIVENSETTIEAVTTIFGKPKE